MLFVPSAAEWPMRARPRAKCFFGEPSADGWMTVAYIARYIFSRMIQEEPSGANKPVWKHGPDGRP